MAGLLSVGGCPLLSVGGCPLLSVGGCPLLSVGGCPLLSVGGCPLLSVGGGGIIVCNGVPGLFSVDGSCSEFLELVLPLSGDSVDPELPPESFLLFEKDIP
jgi:hypothetical protein